MKKIFTTAILCLCILLTGCILDPSASYSFLQQEDQIDRIDILQQSSDFTSWEDRFILCRTLEKEEHASFLADLVKVKGQPFWSPPSTSFGTYVIRIKYLDGAEEYISACNNGYLLPGEQLVYDTYRFTDWEGFDNVILKYLGQV